MVFFIKKKKEKRKEDWGLLNIVQGFTIGESVIGISLSSGTWEISYKYSSLFVVDL